MSSWVLACYLSSEWYLVLAGLLLLFALCRCSPLSPACQAHCIRHICMSDSARLACLYVGLCAWGQQACGRPNMKLAMLAHGRCGAGADWMTPRSVSSTQRIVGDVSHTLR